MMRRDGSGNVIVTITEMEFASLLIALGHAIGSADRQDSKYRRNQFLRLANAINVGNPTFTPYAVDGDPDPVPAPPPAVVSENMTSEEHRSRHAMLHRFLDELVADWIQHNPGKYPSSTPVMDLMKWSHSQTKEPDVSPVDPDPAPAGGGE